MGFSITTERLTLRPLERSDAETVYGYRTEPEVLRFQSWEPCSVEEVRLFIEGMQWCVPGEWFQVGIVLSESGELLGDIGLHPPADEHRQLEVGITVASRFQRRGIATEALNALLAFLFLETETHRVFCSVDPRNFACIGLLERIGMRKEGHFQESVWVKGRWLDDVIFAKLRREWAA